MNRHFSLDRVPPPVPVATREILGGGGLKLHTREWGNPEGSPCCSSTAGRRAICAG
jgi:hypothetical protein